jgi:hypothetical protein
MTAAFFSTLEVALLYLMSSCSQLHFYHWFLSIVFLSIVIKTAISLFHTAFLHLNLVESCCSLRLYGFSSSSSAAFLLYSILDSCPSLPFLFLARIFKRVWGPVPEIIDPVFAKTSQNARFLLSFGLVFVKTGSINSGTGISRNEFRQPKRAGTIPLFLLGS